jgi:hypothetical protein
MGKALEEERVLMILQIIVNDSPEAKLIAIDTEVRGEWQKAKTGLGDLLKLPRNGGTNLPNALANYDLSRTVILTDDDGWHQLKEMSSPPFLVIEVRGATDNAEKTLYFHFNPIFKENTK